MKKNIYTAAVCLLMIIFAMQGISAQGFNSITTPDGTNIVAVGSAGKLYRSANGGASWISISNGIANQNCVTSLGNDVWISGDNGNVYKTLKTVSSVTTYNIGSSTTLYSIKFIDSNTGYVCGNSGEVYKTVNGGVNWTLSNSGIASVRLNSIDFKNASNGTVVGNGGAIYVTNNGGTSWNTQSSGTTQNLLRVKYFGDSLVAAGEYGVLLKYSGSWYSVASKINTDIRGISGTSISDVHLCGGGGFIRNNKSGSSGFLNFEQNPMMAPMNDIFYYGANNGWAVCGTNSVIIRTTNAGVSWTMPAGSNVTYSWVQKQATSGNIGNPFCLHPKNRNGVFILAGSSLYRSFDKGETWTLLRSGIPGSSCHSFFVNAIDTNLMICSKGSTGGNVYKSTDYGANWTALFSPSINLTSYGMPLEVDPNNPNTLYLAPDGDSVMKSTDFGTTWVSLGGGESGNTFRSPCDVVVQYDNPNVIFIADGTTGSGNGKFWKSTNGGYNWTLINTISGSEIPMVANSALDLNLIFHSSWSSGSFWKSTNMGSNFSDLSRSGSLWATDVAKDDPTAVCYDYYGSSAFISVNSGASFASTNVNSTPAAGICFMDKSNLLIQHGGGVYKCVATYTDSTVSSSIDVQVTSVGTTGTAYFSSSTIVPEGTVKNNNGGAPASFTVTRTISPGGYTSTKSVSGLLPNSTEVVYYDPWTFVAGTAYTVRDSVYINADSNPGNDVMSGSVTPYLGEGVTNLSEDFSSAFPPSGWTFQFSGTNYWIGSTASAYGSGNGSAEFNFWSATSGTNQSMFTPVFSTPTISGDSLEYDYAYAPYTDGSTDSIIIETSTDGGSSYSVLVKLYGRNNASGNFALNTTSASGSQFVPSANQWQSKKWALPTGTNRVKFRARSGYGNNFYVDNINVSSFSLYTQYNIKLIPEGYYDGTDLNMRDTVRAYLRNTSSPFAVVDSASAVFDSVTFVAPLVFKNAASGTYYIQLIHRNALETWSKTGGESIVKGVTASYDFTSAQSQSYGDNSILVGAKYCLYSGDVIRDGIIDLSDIVDVFNDASEFEFGYVVTDVNGDGSVDLSDIVFPFNNSSYFITKITPETSPESIRIARENSVRMKSEFINNSREQFKDMNSKMK